MFDIFTDTDNTSTNKEDEKKVEEKNAEEKKKGEEEKLKLEAENKSIIEMGNKEEQLRLQRAQIAAYLERLERAELNKKNGNES